MMTRLAGCALIAIASLCMAGSVLAQRISGPQELPPPPVGGPQTLFEQFASRLGLNGRTQRPQSEQIFTAAAAKALPVAQQMNQLRIRLVNAEIEGNATEVREILDEYIVVAARMAEMEAHAFAKVFALLDDGQQKRAPDAFQLIAGVFVPSASMAPPAGVSGSRSGRGGGQ
jgi:hypothetical protein